MIEHSRYKELSDNEYLKFNRIGHKRSTRPDIHAFMFLDMLFKGNENITCDIVDNILYLSTLETEVAKLDEEQVAELLRCGVRIDFTNDSLYIII